LIALDLVDVKGTTMNSDFVIASVAKQSRILDKSTLFLDRHVASLLATTIYRSALKLFGALQRLAASASPVTETVS